MTTTTRIPAEETAWDQTDVAHYLKASVRHVFDVRREDPSFPRPVQVGRSLRWSPRAVPDWLERGGAVETPDASKPAKKRKGAGRVY
jgi:predicted DNA-binding transcriptional regulator AlpA